MLISVKPVDMLTTSTVHSYLVVGASSVPVSVTVDVEVTVEVTVEVAESVEVGVGPRGGNMFVTVTHPDVKVDVVVNGHSVTVARIPQMVESEGFTVTVCVAHDTAVVVVTARGSMSAAGAADARPAKQKREAKNGLNIIKLCGGYFWLLDETRDILHVSTLFLYYAPKRKLSARRGMSAPPSSITRLVYISRCAS